MNNVVFKQSVMGFNRTQVLEYIDTLVKQLKEQENEYTQKQKELEDEISSLSAKCAENKQDLALTVDKIKELSIELDYFKKNNAELKTQIDHYKNLILTKDGEIVSLKKDTFALKTRCELLTAENESWKKRQDKIGECLIEANMKAEEIVRNAEAEAEQVKQQMVEQTQVLKGDVVNLKEEIARVEAQLEQSFAKLQHAIEQQVDEYKAKIEAIETESKSELPKAQSKDKKVASLADTYAVKVPAKPAKKSLTESVLDTIAKIIG